MSEENTPPRSPVLEKSAPGGEAGGGGPEQSGSSAAHGPEDGGDGGSAGRFWSVRRVPAALVALVLLGAAGMLLYDIASVRADRPAMAWRRTLADTFDETSLDHPVVLASAAVLVVLGLLLIVLAVTPGNRGLLPMRKDRAGLVRAGLDRDAAALILRDRALEVSGVQSARVEVGRRKVRARARAHFRDLDDVRGDLDAALRDGIRSLGLARPLGLAVQVRRPKKG